MKDDRVYLQYIFECIQKIEEDIDCGYDKFMTSHCISGCSFAKSSHADGINATDFR